MSIMPEHLVKRDGSVKPFDAAKITAAIAKAGKATGEFGEKRAQEMCETLVIPKIKSLNLVTPNIEQVQDAVEHALFDSGYFATLRAYIVYREQRAKSRDAKKSWVNVESSINEYLDQLDWRVNANANQGYSLGGLILNVSGKVVANYWLNYIYTPEIGAAHRNADIHIHDLDMLSGYCAGWSLRTVLTEGFNGVPGKVEAGAPKHLSSATGQIVNFLGTMQNEWAGAQAFSSFDTYMAPYIRKDHLPYHEVLQCIQELIYNLNVPSRWGTQTPFTNLTFDWTCPEDLKHQHPVIGGEEQPFTYGELQAEMDMINRAYIEVMMKGDAKGRVFTFPIPTYNMTPDFDWDSPNALRLFDMTARYGLPYFQNFINSELKPNMIRSMCCRLQLDLRELLKRGNGLFGSAEQTGSLGVVTVNCARLGYLYKGNEEELYKRLDHLLDLAKQSLEIKRKVIQRHIDQGLFPYTKRYLGTLRNHFSTIGVNGINEMIRNFTGDTDDITTDWGHAFAVRFLDHVRERLVQFQAETDHMYNLEATPAEGTTYRFAKEDKKRFPNILQAGTPKNPYYTNSSQLPVGFTDDPFQALEMQEDLQKKYTGGTVLHLYMNEAISSAEACRDLVRRTLTRFRLPYITITPTFSICPKHGYIPGRHDFCPICDAELIAKKRAALAAKEKAAA
ncbi:ribonucleoside triphosphate reductase [Duodenibacillus massiliensis]|jgi:anaerobic ribonucleoside-triphosphate reductase|uniref:ribonucleoside triphosphate reductase n=1 Tax=Duodenibacillus massiliensis TaxID=1852381 RepID=UPI0003396A32|nr:ribonucleoside triphosphate reductase [Duodenibacillus massiliensis]CDD70952.1 anaerobic ribonucleoside-triphosphate reductase [Sutterella sp. CAG:397]HAF64350.1 ribonucleoside triphosphate reductase [Sutterella sp.]